MALEHKQEHQSLDLVRLRQVKVVNNLCSFMAHMASRLVLRVLLLNNSTLIHHLLLKAMVLHHIITTPILHTQATVLLLHIMTLMLSMVPHHQLSILQHNHRNSHLNKHHPKVTKVIEQVSNVDHLMMKVKSQMLLNLLIQLRDLVTVIVVMMDEMEVMIIRDILHQLHQRPQL